MLAPDFIIVLLEEVRLLDAAHLTNLCEDLAYRLETLVLRQNHGLVLLASFRQVLVNLILNKLFILSYFFLMLNFLKLLSLLISHRGILGFLLLLTSFDLGLSLLLDLFKSSVLDLLSELWTLDPLGMLLS